MHPDNLKSVKIFSLRYGFKVCTGARYIVGFIGDNDSKHDWFEKHTETWERNITNTRKTAVKDPQESYAAVVCANQWEWVFLQRVTKNTEDEFTSVEKILWETLFASTLIKKIIISHTPHRSSKYNVGQETRPGPSESRDVCGQKYLSS